MAWKLNISSPEIDFKVERELHKNCMKDLIEEINDEYFRRYEYQEWEGVNLEGNYTGYPDNNYHEKPTVAQRHGKILDIPKPLKYKIKKKIN